MNDVITTITTQDAIVGYKKRGKNRYPIYLDGKGREYMVRMKKSKTLDSEGLPIISLVRKYSYAKPDMGVVRALSCGGRY